MLKSKKIILGVCGSIAAYKAGDIIRRLQEQHCNVVVVMTAQAQQFIPALTLSTLAGQEAIVDLFGKDGWRMPHIEAAKDADAVLIAPATANMIAKIAHGLADDLLSTLVLTTRAPLFVAPAMHDGMYLNAIVQENCAKLKKRGICLIEPIKGRLAGGDIGIGHLAEVEDIVKAVLKGV